jgi:hypothetical protein
MRPFKHCTYHAADGRRLHRGTQVKTVIARDSNSNAMSLVLELPMPKS